MKFTAVLLAAIFFSMPTVSLAASSQSAKGFKPVSRAAVEDAQQPFHGNVKTLKYHSPVCDHYNCKTCTKIFKTREAAQKAGYVPCGKCGG